MQLQGHRRSSIVYAHKQRYIVPFHPFTGFIHWQSARRQPPFTVCGAIPFAAHSLCELIHRAAPFTARGSTWRLHSLEHSLRRTAPTLILFATPFTARLMSIPLKLRCSIHCAAHSLCGSIHSCIHCAFHHCAAPSTVRCSFAVRLIHCASTCASHLRCTALLHPLLRSIHSGSTHCCNTATSAREAHTAGDEALDLVFCMTKHFGGGSE